MSAARLELCFRRNGMKNRFEERRAATALMIAVCAAALALSILLAVSVGAVRIPLGDVYRIILYKLTHIQLGDVETLAGGTRFEIIWNVRLPRVLMGAIVGVLLSLSGVVMQATVQNPLADPYILGISSGASLGATFSIMIGAQAVFTGWLAGTGTAFWAFVGSLAATVLVYTIASLNGRMTSAKLVLAGSVIGSVCGALTNLMIYIGNNADDMKSVTYWLLGSMTSARWSSLALPGACMLAGLVFFLTQLRTLNTLLLGDEAAITLGVNLGLWRKVYMVVVSLMTAVAVCTCGIVGFVGLMIPHIVRAVVGSDHRRLLPVAAMVGGTFLIWADVLARVLIPNTDIPIGVITSAVGAPVFVYMMVRKSYGFGGHDA